MRVGCLREFLWQILLWPDGHSSADSAALIVVLEKNAAVRTRDAIGTNYLGVFTKRDRVLAKKLAVVYFSFAPLGTSSRKLASTGWPSSPTEAASSMPLDSSPRILRGWRFATITILRPTKFSGL